MAAGIYKAISRRKELDSAFPEVFTNNLQVWLSVFAFSTYIAGFFAAIGRWLFMLEEISHLMFFAMVVCFILALGFAVTAIYSFRGLIALLYHAVKGTPYEYDCKTPVNVISAIRPVEAMKNTKEYLAIRSMLVEHNKQLNKQIERNDKLVSQYSAIIEEMKKA